MNTQYRKYKGFSLAEAMIAMVIVGSTAATILVPFSTGAQLQAEGIRRTIAANLAEDMMNRIVITDFDSIISSYGSYTESQGQVTDIEGNIITDNDYTLFSRTASCNYVYTQQESGSLPAGFIRATVTVLYDGQQVTRIDRLISK
ncbi:MAG: prepilin-type N-terminal cleavage/methylation domain-containing protein [Phycisphaerae bacterium]|nr:prepilin-type N-terminal cleavage/methylation domain-containing protein [Phycisphaerae bacterium]